VEQRPTTNHRVKYCDQLLYRSVKIFLDSGFGFGKEGSDILSGGFDEEFIVVFPNMAAKKIKCDLMAERGVTVVHTTVLRWAQCFVPAFEKLWKKYARPVGSSWRVDETYIKVIGSMALSLPCGR
jgi:hypothetical protein